MVSRFDKGLIVLTVINITVCGFILMVNSNVKYVPQVTAAPVVEPAPFDHSGCQYPDRTTNPPNGCDNSDPCDPANVKGGSGDCDDVAVPPVTEPEADWPIEPVELMQGK